MKKTIIVAMAALMASVLMFVGCTPNQIETVAQQAGVASIVTWISVDHPTDAKKLVAAEVVKVIKENASMVEAGVSYYVILSPVITAYIEEKVAPESQIMAKLAGGWVLTGVDTFFAMYPKYANDAKAAAKIVSFFCDGALAGLALPPDSEVLKAATRGANSRAVLRKTIL